MLKLQLVMEWEVHIKHFLVIYTQYWLFLLATILQGRKLSAYILLTCLTPFSSWYSNIYNYFNIYYFDTRGDLEIGDHSFVWMLRTLQQRNEWKDRHIFTYHKDRMGQRFSLHHHIYSQGQMRIQYNAVTLFLNFKKSKSIMRSTTIEWLTIVIHMFASFVRFTSMGQKKKKRSNKSWATVE